jgi:hypothetical protein
MDYKRNSSHGRAKCFHCLLSPVTDDPIFVGVNGLFTKGLEGDTMKTRTFYTVSLSYNQQI